MPITGDGRTFPRLRLRPGFDRNLYRKFQFGDTSPAAKSVWSDWYWPSATGGTISLTASQQVGSFTQSATAAVTVSATASQAVGSFTQTAIAQAVISAIASQQVGDFSQVATLVTSSTISAQAAQIVGDFTTSATLAARVTAAAAQLVGDFGTAATATVTVKAFANQQVGDFGQVATLQNDATSEQPEVGGGIATFAPSRRWLAEKKRKEEDESKRRELERLAQEEAERQAAEALEAFEAEEQQKYLARLRELVAQSAPVRVANVPLPDYRLIAAEAVQALVVEVGAEFDQYVARLEIERDEEDALVALLLAA